MTETEGWSLIDLKIYITPFAFENLNAYKVHARAINEAGGVDGKKIPVSPDLYFKKRNAGWEGVPHFLAPVADATTIAPGDEVLDSDVAANVEALEEALDADVSLKPDVRATKVEKLKVMNTSDLKVLNQEVISQNVIDGNLLFKDFDVTKIESEEDNKYSNIQVAFTEERILTNMTYYSKYSTDGKTAVCKLMVSSPTDNPTLLQLVIFPIEEINDSTLMDIVKSVLFFKPVKDGEESVKIFNILKYLSVKENVEEGEVLPILMSDRNYNVYMG